MHEFAIAQDIVTSLERSLGDDFNNLQKINISFGTFSGIVSDSLSFGLEALLKTEKENNPVEINIIEKKTIADCKCGNKYEIKEIFDSCPVCKSVVRELSGGSDICVDSVEIKEEGD